MLSRISSFLVSIAIIGGAVLVPATAADASSAAVDDAYTLGAAAPFSAPAESGLLANDVDLPVAKKIVVLIAPRHGAFTALDTQTGAFGYRPVDDFLGADVFTYCVWVGSGCVTDPATVTLNVVPHLERIGAVDRYALAASVSASRFAPGVNTVVVASGEVFPDALSGGAAAGTFGGPVLLVSKGSIPGVVQAELARLSPKHITLLGGLNTVGAEVEAALRGYAPNVNRLDGVDRYAVSAAISTAAFGPDRPVVYIASGEVFPDALSASAAAGLQSSPVLLVRHDAVPASVASAIARLKPARIVVLGGANSIEDSVVTTLKATAPTTRIAGADRYSVSAATSESSFDPAKTPVVYIASGEVFPDALSGSPAAIAQRAPVLLVSRDAIPSDVAAELTRLQPHRIVVLGGLNTISAQVETGLAAYLAP